MTLAQPYRLQAHITNRPVLLIQPVILALEDKAAIKAQKAFIENTIAIYRLTFPDDASLYLPFIRQSESCPDSVVIGMLQLTGPALHLQEAAACLTALFSRWEQVLDTPENTVP